MQLFVVRPHLESRVHLFHSYTVAMQFIARKAVELLTTTLASWRAYYKTEEDIDLIEAILELKSIGDYQSIFDLFNQKIGGASRNINSNFDLYEVEIEKKEKK